jgi:ABC-type antimicrobial peptide transport system permease subunit
MLTDRASNIGHLMVRTSTDVAGLLPLVRQTIREYDPFVVVTSTSTMEELLTRSMAEERFRASLSMTFGALALTLAAVGLYGLAARRLAERRPEFGLRLALGAHPQHVRALMLRDAMKPVGLGLIVGLPMAYVLSQVLRALLFGVTPTAPHTFLGASAVLIGVAAMATFLPALRAGRIDPILAMRD